MKKIYSGFFLVGPKADVMRRQLNRSDLHVTWEFNPGHCKLPQGVKEGDLVNVHVVGRYKDSEIACWVVQVLLPNGQRLVKQPTGTVLHITTWSAPRVPAVESGLRATKKGWDKFQPKDQFMLTAQADYFKA